MNKIDINSIISSSKIEKLGKENVTVLIDDFSENQKVAIAKAVLYIISADGVVTDEEKRFFARLCVDLKADNGIMERAVALSDEAMFESLKSVTEEQENYILSCLNSAAYADNELASEESALLESFTSNMKKEAKSENFYAKILTF
ncbi:MAG: TerB family tellurite resistance protein [Paludibacteraceae bacterium]|nr:TerB family tellurite resistance protein [Paludibacteraceae bacterium]